MLPPWSDSRPGKDAAAKKAAKEAQSKEASAKEAAARAEKAKEAAVTWRTVIWGWWNSCVFQGDFMDFNGILWVFNGILEDLVGFNGLEWKSMLLSGILRFYDSNF